jgi:hypothetical protein
MYYYIYRIHHIIAMLSSFPVQKIISKSAKHWALYNRISPILFDVSLRDGIQGAPVANWPTQKKLETFDKINDTYCPHSIEIGSICSYKVLPIMADTNYIYNHATCAFSCTDNIPSHTTQKAYVLVPSISKLATALSFGMTNMSFITSVSEQFQRKNTKRSLLDIKSEFSTLFTMLDKEPRPEQFVKKLYISCINECPISGKLDNDVVINEILYYSRFPFDEFCLSDTCGTLKYDDFQYILDTLVVFGIPLSAISLHLHVPADNIENVEHNLRYCFRKGVRRFDVSIIETGGCSVTMDHNRLLPNLSYDQFYHILDKHITSVVENNNV